MSETGKQEERFKAGQVWHNPATNRVCLIGLGGKTFRELRGGAIPITTVTPAHWRDAGYVLLTETDRLDVLEGRVDALSAKVDALERPATTKAAPEPDVPRPTAKIDCLSQLRHVTWDGHVICPSYRDDFVKCGYVQRWNGWNWLTQAGVEVLVNLGIVEVG